MDIILLAADAKSKGSSYGNIAGASKIIMIAGFVLAAICFAFAIFAFVKYQIPKTVNDLNGKTAKKAVAKMREKNEQTGVKTFGPTPVAKERGTITAVMNTANGEGSDPTALLNEVKAQQPSPIAPPAPPINTPVVPPVNEDLTSPLTTPITEQATAPMVEQATAPMTEPVAPVQVQAPVPQQVQAPVQTQTPVPPPVQAPVQAQAPVPPPVEASTLTQSLEEEDDFGTEVLGDNGTEVLGEETSILQPTTQAGFRLIKNIVLINTNETID